MRSITKQMRMKRAKKNGIYTRQRHTNQSGCCCSLTSLNNAHQKFVQLEFPFETETIQRFFDTWLWLIAFIISKARSECASEKVKIRVYSAVEYSHKSDSCRLQPLHCGLLWLFGYECIFWCAVSPKCNFRIKPSLSFLIFTPYSNKSN